MAKQKKVIKKNPEITDEMILYKYRERERETRRNEIRRNIC